MLQVDMAGTGESTALLMVLADGMGGAPGGATASHTVVEAFKREFPQSGGKTGARLRKCLEAATASLRDEEIRNPRLKGLGSTVVAVLYDGHGIDWLSVGDSPMWLFSAPTLVRLNADHSLGPELDRLVRAGSLSPDDARTDWRRHVLRSVVGGKAPELVDRASRSFRLRQGDYLLIASDGVETLTEDEIAQALRTGQGRAEAASDALMSAVRAAAGPSQDNVTFLLLSAEAEPEDRAGAGLAAMQDGSTSRSRTARGFGSGWFRGKK